MNLIAYEGYSKLLSRQTGTYRVISVDPEYTKIDHNGIQNTVSINRLVKVAKEARSNVDSTSDSRANAEIDPAKEASTEDKKNFYAAAKVVGHENRSKGTHYIVRWYGFGPQDDTVKSIKHISHHSQEAYCRRLRKCQKKPKSTKQMR